MTKKSRSNHRRHLNLTDEQIAGRVATLALVRERYPAVFCDEPKPLAIGTRTVLKDMLGVSNEAIDYLMAWWVTRPAYIRALTAPDSKRWNLDGTVAEDVSAEHRDYKTPLPHRPKRPPQEERVIMSATVKAKSLKVAIVLEASDIARLNVPANVNRVMLRVEVSGRAITADLNAKAVCKCIAAIEAAGPAGVSVILQGELEGDAITEAGIVAQPWTPKPATRNAVAV